MRPEAECLLSLLRGDPVRRRMSGIDAGALLDLARSHQVDALAYWLLENAPSCSTDLPEPVSAGLRLGYLHHMMRNEVLAENLADVQTALGQRGVRALFFKGPWLAFQAYPDPGTRPVDDIDLGIHEEDYLAARAALESLGYRSSGPLPRTSAAALRRAHFGTQLRFASRGRRPVEMHFRMVNIGPPAVEENSVWNDAREMTVGGATLRVPGPEAMLLHLLLHANQHAFALLRLLFDVRFALESYRSGLDWATFRDRAHALRCASSAYHGLLLARDLAGAEVSAETLAALRPGSVRRGLFRAFWDVDRVRRLETRRRSSKVESPRVYLLELGRWRDKARYLAGIGRQAVRRETGIPH